MPLFGSGPGGRIDDPILSARTGIVVRTPAVYVPLRLEVERLEFLQRLLKVVDFKLLGLLVERHVDHRVFEEPTDIPPGPHFYTPDKGYTWLRVTLEDATRHFLFSRLLALIFDF